MGGQNFLYIIILSNYKNSKAKVAHYGIHAGGAMVKLQKTEHHYNHLQQCYLIKKNFNVKFNAQDKLRINNWLLDIIQNLNNYRKYIIICEILFIGFYLLKFQFPLKKIVFALQLRRQINI